MMRGHQTVEVHYIAIGGILLMMMYNAYPPLAIAGILIGVGHGAIWIKDSIVKTKVIE
jgi:hypothetical protein